MTVVATVAAHEVTTTKEVEAVGVVMAARRRTPIVAIATCIIKRCANAIRCSRKEDASTAWTKRC